MTDLEALIAAVDAGLSWPADSEQWDTIGVDGMDAADAYNGSLDAALRLHEALLPGWELTHMGQHEAGWMVAVARLGPPTRHEGGHPTTPARAWLLAILRVLKAKGDA